MHAYRPADYRDCSSLTKDLLMPFGIWMPRSSAHQSRSGKLVGLEGKNDREIKELLVQIGQPFFSLITMPGHIVLYVGTYQETPYIYHNMWGFCVRNLSNKRLVAGKAVLMLLDWGREDVNKKILANTFFDRATSVLLLHDRLVNPAEPLPLFENLIQA